MLEIIPAQKIKIIPWPDEENLVVFKRTRQRILFMGFTRYLGTLKKKKRRPGNTLKPTI